MLALPMSLLHDAPHRRHPAPPRRRARRCASSSSRAASAASLDAVVQLARRARAAWPCYSPMLTGVFLLTVPVYAGLMVFSARVLQADLRRPRGELRRSTPPRQIDAIKGIETVKAPGAEDTLRELMLEQFLGARPQAVPGRLHDHGVRRRGAASRPARRAALFLWVGAREVLDGDLTIGALRRVQRPRRDGVRADRDGSSASGTSCSARRCCSTA